jgi:hypothetical protein
MAHIIKAVQYLAKHHLAQRWQTLWPLSPNRHMSRISSEAAFTEVKLSPKQPYSVTNIYTWKCTDCTRLPLPSNEAE